MSSVEVCPTRRFVVALMAAAALLYLPMLGLPELRVSDEALWGNLAARLVDSGDYLTPALSPEHRHCFPLYAWLVAACSFFRHPTSWSVRLPAALAVFGMAATAGLAARRLKDALAGYAAAAVVLTSYVSLKLGVVGQSEAVHAFFLSSAWVAWHRYGCREERWTKAWATALGLVFLGTLTAGIKALLLFYFPLILTRKPGKNIRNLETSTHAVFLGLFIVALAVWSRYTTFPAVLGSFSRIYQEPSVSLLGHLWRYPAKIFLYMAPWSLFLWAPFCLALRQFEPGGSACGYYRATIFCPFLLFWLVPGYSPLLLFACLVPAAILIGIHFEIVVRRHSHGLLWTCEVLSWPIFLGLLLLGVFWLRVAGGGIRVVPALSTPALQGAVSGACAGLLFLAAFQVQRRILRRGRCCPALEAFLLMVFAARLLHVLSVGALGCWLVPDHRLKSLALFDAAPEGAFTPIVTEVLGPEPPPEMSYRDLRHPDGVVYVHSDVPYPVEAFYSRKRWRYIQRPNTELPQDAPVVFLLSPRIPAVPARDWTPVGPTVDMNTRRNTSFEFSGNILRLRGRLCRRNTDARPARPPRYLRLYRGELRREEPPAPAPAPTTGETAAPAAPGPKQSPN